MSLRQMKQNRRSSKILSIILWKVWAAFLRPKRRRRKSKESDDADLQNIGRPHRNLEITLLEVKFGKELGTGDSRGEKRNSREKVSVWDHGSVEVAEVPTRSSGSIRLRDHVKRTGPG